MEVTFTRQPDLFSRSRWPEGFRYGNELITPDEEQTLLAHFAGLPFREFEFHGFTGKRRVVSYGWRYDFGGGGLKQADAIPEFLLPLRAKASAFVRIEAPAFEQVLLTEYRPGAAIGWHRDRSVFGEVVGISLMSACTFRFRKRKGDRWERVSLLTEPRSIYLLQGPSRTEWEHSIPGLDSLRYSVTFRSLARRE
jgi:alkylated DNA repair dioxygenase AlkB